MLLGGRDGTAQPMARGDMEQFQVASKLLQDLKHSPIMGFLKDQWCLQVDDMSWAPVKTKMTLERSYQCAVGLSRSLSSRIIINHINIWYSCICSSLASACLTRIRTYDLIIPGFKFRTHCIIIQTHIPTTL